MNIKELKLRKQYLENKLDIVNSYIDILSDSDLDDIDNKLADIIKYKFDLLTKIRNYKIILDRENTKNTISVGDTTLTVYEALHVLDSILLKIKTFEDLLKTKSIFNLKDSLDLFSKSDKLFEEYLQLKLSITTSDLNFILDKD